MKKLFIIIIPVILLSCKNQSNEKADYSDQTEKQEIFPVASFVANQVHQVDSLQLPVVKYFTSNFKTDTALISTNDFKFLAKEFMEPDITKSTLRNYYKEASFADQTIPSVILTYSTGNHDLEVQRIDVIIHPDPVLTDRVSTIYMEKTTHLHDTLITKKLLLESKQNFQIITSLQTSTKTATASILKVVWDNTD